MRTTLGLEQWLARIDGIHPGNWVLGLERVGAVADRMGLRKPAPRSVIVAGTNGKGSCCVCLEQILLAAGLRVGCTLSPHLQRFNERVRIDGAELDDETLCQAFALVEAGRGDIPLTYFEFTSLAALHCFRQAEVEVAVLEVGLGGRLDAFNLVDAEAALITSIGIDHTDYLGDTRERIGAEKAGVLRAVQQVALGPDMPDSVLQAAARLAGRCLRFGRNLNCAWDGPQRWRAEVEGRCFEQLPAIPFPLANGALAIAAAHALGEADDQAVRQGLASAWLPGRFETIAAAERQWVVDVGHNPLAAAWLRGELIRRFPGAAVIALLGTLADKDVEGLFRVLDGLVQRWVLVDAPPPRGLSAEALAKRISRRSLVVAGSVAQGIEQARSLARPGNVILAFGSFAVAQSARTMLAAEAAAHGRGIQQTACGGVA